tara:strand:+ start:535 stop:663 length:129 start_codon:yes stop_codon:yes gene_type:complete
MAVTELIKDTHEQIFDLLENLKKVEKLNNKDISISFDKLVMQ